MNQHDIHVTPVDGADQAPIRTLLSEFHQWLSETVPVDYDPAMGLEKDVRSQAEDAESWAWVAYHDGEPAGCVLLYGETDDLAEFRRLWVRPEHRGHGIGRRLTRTVIDRARAEEYETLGLTTPPQGTAAHSLYESLGFERTTPYPETRLDEQHHDEAIFMQLDLASGESTTADA